MTDHKETVHDTWGWVLPDELRMASSAAYEHPDRFTVTPSVNAASPELVRVVVVEADRYEALCSELRRLSGLAGEED